MQDFDGLIQSELFESVQLQVPLELFELPQELVNEIFEYVPEYGHRVSKELHELSLQVVEASIYSDFYRYCARLPMSSMDICIQLLEEKYAEDLKNDAIKYLKKNLQELVSRYLDNRESVHKNIFEYVGISLAHRISDIDCGYYDKHDVYKKIEWRAKVIELYSLMILRDSGLMVKKEFDAKCLEIADLEIILEIVFAVFLYYEHIFSTAIRYFSSEPIMKAVIKRLNNKTAVSEDILFNNDYSFSHDRFAEYTEYYKAAKKMDRSNLQEIHDRILDAVPEDAYYDSETNVKLDIRQALFMIEMMADEE